MRVKEDLVRGASAGYDLQTHEIIRVFQVWDLTSYNANIKIAQALIAVDSISPSLHIPQMTEHHPDPALYDFVVVDVRTGPDVSHDVIDVFVRYRYRVFAGGFLKTYAGSLRTVPRTLLHADGTVVETSYLPTGSSASAVNRAFFVDKILVGGTFSFRRMEALDPEYFNCNYAGSVNWQAWRGYPARTLMLLPIIANTEDNYWYNNQYTFDYREDTFDTYSLYYLEDGTVPPEVAKDVKYDGTLFGNGWQRVPPEYQVDFAALFPWIPNVPPSSYGFPKSEIFHRWGV